MQDSQNNLQFENEVISNALEFIKASTICTNPKYKWIQSAIWQLLDNDYDHDNLDQVVSTLFGNNAADYNVKDDLQLDEVEACNEKTPHRNIKYISSIENVDNVGLISEIKPIMLKDDINVFYGKNGSGKSSLYFAMCGALGKSKKILANVKRLNEDCLCGLKCVDFDNSEFTINWKSPSINPDFNVKIFDSQVCNKIVSDDQANLFSLAHLREECFGYLHDLFDKVAQLLETENEKNKVSYSELKNILIKNVPFIFNENEELQTGVTRPQIEQLSEIEKTTLEGLEKELRLCNKETLSAKIKNLNNAITKLDEIFHSFGRSVESKSDNEKMEKVKYRLYYDTQFLENANAIIDTHNQAKEALQLKSSEKLPGSLPRVWIENDEWKDIIIRSIKFIDSLDDEDKTKYTEKTCFYCQQPLANMEARSIIRAYRELQVEYENKLIDSKKRTEKISIELEKSIEVFDNLNIINKILEDEFANIGMVDQKITDYSRLTDVFVGVKKDIALYNPIEIGSIEFEEITKFWEEYVEIGNRLTKKIESLQEDNENNEEKRLQLTAEILPLRNKDSLLINKDVINKCYVLLKDMKNNSERLADLTNLRRQTSKQKTDFSKIATIKEFKKILYEEYEYLKFTPPSAWQIAPMTREDVNKRVYSVGDKRLADIFSEGEKTIHALADFLTHARLEKYNGVFIFDDPVNSLDESYIENVADRLKKLVNDGHQILVFTHNLFFLNSIIDPEKTRLTSLENIAEEIFIETDTLLDCSKLLKVKKRYLKEKLELLKEIAAQNKKIPIVDIRQVYDMMSGYLETWVEAHLLHKTVIRYRPNVRMNNLPKIAQIDKAVFQDVCDLYERCSRRCERHSHPTDSPAPEYNEMLADYKKLEENYK
ncbi:MAG: AAA family ATPase [Promethearchaeota archaeon]